jgi:hypothetical protein
MRRILSVVLFTLFVQTTIAQQPLGVSVQGVITQRGSDEVVWGASVELRKEGGNTALYGAVTGPDGKFAFPSVPAGRYQLLATSPGYVPAEYGQKRMKGAGLPLIVEPGRPISDIRLDMVQTGAISGRVTDAFGQPIAIADVFALKSSYQEGQRILTQTLSAKTDERGEFRMFWLTPGTYYVNVVVPDGTNQASLIMNADGFDNGNSVMGVRTILRDVLSHPIGTGAGENEAHVPIYFPSTPNPQQARAIEVRAGDDIHGINLIAGVVRTFHIRGTVAGFAPGGTAQAQGRLIPLDPAWPPVAFQIDFSTGKFDASRVVPGPYILYVQMRPSPQATPSDVTWASLPLEVGQQDVDNLAITTRSGISLPGKVVVDGQPAGAPTSLAAGLFLGMRPDPLVTQLAPSPSTRVSNDGTFILSGAIAGNYRMYAPPLLNPNNPQLISGLPPAPSSLANSYVKAIRVGGADVLDSGVHLTSTEGLTMEIVLGINAGAIEGRVVRGGQPAAEVTVGILPNAVTARGFRTDMHKTTLTDAFGKFQFHGLPPGDYKVFAWEEADKDAIMDLDFVRGYEERGTRLEIGDGDRKSIELNVIPARTP